MKRLLILSLVAIAGFGSAEQLAAQAKPEEKVPQNLPATGSELFRGLLNYRKIEPVLANQIPNDDDYYSRLIVVVMGLPSTRDPNAFDPRGVVVRTLRAGGSVLIAADGSGSLASYFPIRRNTLQLTGESVYQPDETRCLNGNGWCSFAQPLAPSADVELLWQRQKRSPSPEWSLFAGLKRIATNVPAALNGVDSSRYTRYSLAGFPKGSEVGVPDGKLLAADRVLAVGSSGIELDDELPFRCLIVADPSIFSNQMMAADLDGAGPGTDNLAFANNVAQFLRGPDERKKCLFVESGAVVSKFDDVLFSEQPQPNLPPLPIPSLPSPLDPEVQRKLTDAANGAIDKWETNDGPNRLLVGRPPTDDRFANVATILMIAAAILVGFVVLRRFFAHRYKADFLPIPNDTGRVASSGPPGSLARRKEEILHGGNFTGPVREYLRELFLSRGLVLPEGGPPRKLPAVEATGMYSQELRSHLKALWTVAFEPKPKPIGYARWKELEAMIDAVKRAAENDEWRFVPGGRS